MILAAKSPRQKLSKERRSEIAKAGAAKRWANARALDGQSSKKDYDAKAEAIANRKALYPRINYVSHALCESSKFEGWEPPGHCVIPLDYALFDQQEEYAHMTAHDPDYATFVNVAIAWNMEYRFWYRCVREALENFRF